MAQTLEPELLASSAIEGSAPKGVPVTVAMADPSIGVGPSRSLVCQATIRSRGEETGSIGPGGWTRAT